MNIIAGKLNETWKSGATDGGAFPPPNSDRAKLSRLATFRDGVLWQVPV
jgi:hypothetical protein